VVGIYFGMEGTKPFCRFGKLYLRGRGALRMNGTNLGGNGKSRLKIVQSGVYLGFSNLGGFALTNLGLALSFAGGVKKNKRVTVCCIFTINEIWGSQGFNFKFLFVFYRPFGNGNVGGFLPGGQGKLFQ